MPYWAAAVVKPRGGILLAEIQQTSDATFRLFDWNRRDAQGHSRTLHIEQALASIHWNRGPVLPVHAPFLPEEERGLEGPAIRSLGRGRERSGTTRGGRATGEPGSGAGSGRPGRRKCDRAFENT